MNRLEVLVCDGMSTDKTAERIGEITTLHPNVCLLVNTRRTTPFALNMGLKKGKGSIKIILGAHSTVDKDFLINCVKTLDRFPEVGCVGGIILNESLNEAAHVISAAMTSPFGVGNAYFRTGGKEGFVDTVAFGAYRDEVFHKIGYFDEDLIRNQDDEFNYRLIKNGFKIYLNPEIRSTYYVRGSFKKLYKQYYQYGYWKVYVNKKHRAVTSVRQLIPALFVLFVLAGLICSIFSKIGLFLFLAVLFIYFLAGTFFAYKVAPKSGGVLKIFYTFLILHLSYGAGYIEGIVNFILLGKSPSKASSTLTR